MNKATAKKTSIMVLQSNALLNQYLMDLEVDLEKSEYKEQCQKFGKVMAEIYLEILKPLWEKYPDLLPSEMDGTYQIDQKLFKEIYEFAQRQTENYS
jgi:hypothetical protein